MRAGKNQKYCATPGKNLGKKKEKIDRSFNTGLTFCKVYKFVSLNCEVNSTQIICFEISYYIDYLFMK